MQSGGWEGINGWKNLWKRCVLSLEWKRVGLMDGESGDDGAGEWNEKNMNYEGE